MKLYYGGGGGIFNAFFPTHLHTDRGKLRDKQIDDWENQTHNGREIETLKAFSGYSLNWIATERERLRSWSDLEQYSPEEKKSDMNWAKFPD